MFAIVTIAGKQYQVTKGDVISVDRLEGNTGDVLSFDHVLLVSDDKTTKIGTPTVSGVKVKAKILAQKKGEKINVRRFKSKVRYRKSTGFRSRRTSLEIIAVG